MDNRTIGTILKSMKRDAEVLIVGGGLNGPALALALAQGGIRSHILDATPPAIRDAETFDGRAYALALSTRRMLNALGLWKDLAEHAQPILDIKVSDGRPGEGASPLFTHFDHREIEDGPMGHLIEDRYLRQALTMAVEASDLIKMQAPAVVTAQAIDRGGVTITLADGSQQRGSVLIGCDGRCSQVAERAGIGRVGWDYHQTSLVCAIEHEKPHNGIAHQFFMPSGPLAILPLPGNRSSIVWTETTARAATINAMADADYLTELRPRFGEFLGGLSLAGARFSYPLGLSLADSLTSERLALAGDAAHGIHPLAGQGLNLGLRDVAALSEVLIEARRRGEDIGAADVLDRYARWRRFDTVALAAATDGINRLFSNDNPLLRLGRDLALGLVGSFTTTRRALIREAAGLTGDLPKLMR